MFVKAEATYTAEIPKRKIAKYLKKENDEVVLFFMMHGEK